MYPSLRAQKAQPVWYLELPPGQRGLHRPRQPQRIAPVQDRAPDLQQLEVEGLHGFDVLRDEEQRVEQLLLARTRDQLPLRATATAGLVGGWAESREILGGLFYRPACAGIRCAKKSAMEMAAQKWAMEMAAAGPAGGQLRGVGLSPGGTGLRQSRWRPAARPPWTAA